MASTRVDAYSEQARKLLRRVAELTAPAVEDTLVREALQALSHKFLSAYRDIHDLILARSSAGKLAKLLLS